MKHVGRQPKRQPKYPWQRMKQETPQEERDLIVTLTEGLEKSGTIYELITGITVWLSNVAKLERAKQAAAAPKVTLVKPTEAEFQAVTRPQSPIVVSR